MTDKKLRLLRFFKRAFFVILFFLLLGYLAYFSYFSSVPEPEYPLQSIESRLFFDGGSKDVYVVDAKNSAYVFGLIADDLYESGDFFKFYYTHYGVPYFPAKGGKKEKEAVEVLRQIRNAEMNLSFQEKREPNLSVIQSILDELEKRNPEQKFNPYEGF
ncbi:MAG: hypothetical protein WBK77_00680 [Alphaproteobacteria bacterium]